MAIALSTILLAALAALIGAGAVGYAAHADPARFSAHFLLGLVAALLGVFGHAMTMFYFIGTGKAIKDVVRERGLDAGLLAETRRQNARASMWATGAIACLMCQFILGGGVHTGAVPRIVHEATFYLTLAVSGLAAAAEIRLLAQQNLLADRVSDLASGTR